MSQLLPAIAPDVSHLLLQKMPSWLWYWLGGIFAVFLLSLVYGGLRARACRKAVRHAISALDAMPPLTEEERRHGRVVGQLDAWRLAYDQHSGEKRRLANEIERGLLKGTGWQGESRYWLQEDHESKWNREPFVERFANMEFLGSVPAVLTGLGLIGTFVAIAYGLLGLSPGEGGVINGVNGLLEGLGGKFTSSIGALSFALIFQLIDTGGLQPSFSKSRRLFLDAVDDSFPRLSPTQQVADILESQRKQERSLANISSDVVTQFGAVFSSSMLPDLSRALGQSVQSEMGPVLESIAAGIANLEQAIQRLESARQESVGEELRALTRNLESSLKAALVEMGDNFQAALAGSADGEFKQAAEAMRGAGEMLRGMQGTFDSMQSALARLMTDAEERTARTFAEGEGRTRALNDLVESLVRQLQDSAASSVQQSSQMLADTMAGMSQRVTAMTAELERRSHEAAERNMQSSAAIVERLGDAAGRTTAETERVLATLGARSDDFVAAADQLRELRTGVERVLHESGARVRDLHEAATAFRGVAIEAAALTRELRGTSEVHRKALEGSSVVIAGVGEVVREQSAVAERARESFSIAGEMLARLDGDLARALQAVVNGMQDYNTQVERNFETILGKVNKEMPALFDRLEQSLQQVASAVEELTETLSRTHERRP